MDTPPDSETPESAAPSSRWARALAGESAALRELAESYWYCVYAWWRRGERGDAAAATQACFTRWLTDAPPHAEQTGAARFREWLAARLAEIAEQSFEPVTEPAIEIALEWAEQRFAQEPPGTADEIFQRRWALTVLEFTMEALRAEYAARGEAALFDEVTPYASFAGGDEDRYEATARRLGFTVGAARRAVFDFRSRHRDLLRSFAGDTLADTADIDSELTALLIGSDSPGSGAVDAPLPTAIRAFQPDELFARAMQSVRMTGGGAGLWTPPSDEEIARLFPQYEMLGILGRGGMGAVYKARHAALDRFVAIKLLPLEISVNRDFADRFVREARAMAKLHHPHIVTVFDFGTTAEGHLFFAMEFVEGANLHEIIHGPGLAPAQALGIIVGVCEAVAYAHGKGVVHRDIKPANVMVSTEGEVKVADFGLARLTDPSAAPLGHTMTGTVMGTPDYMAPEQTKGLHVDHRADIYSLGVMLYEMLCQDVPRGFFDPPSVRAGTDARLDEVVKRAMQQQPERRYQQTTEMRADVERVRSAMVPPSPSLPAAAAHAERADGEGGRSARSEDSRGGQREPRAPRQWKPALWLAAAAVLFLSGIVFVAVPRRSPLSGPGSADSGGKETRFEPGGVPALPVAAAWRDLLAGLDLPRATIAGTWKEVPGGLEIEHINAGSFLEFDYVVPSDYEFEIEFTPTTEGFDVQQYLSMAGRAFIWKLDAYNHTPPMEGIDLVDGLICTHPAGAGRTRAARLAPGQRYTSRVEVRPGSVRAVVDGGEAFAWEGDAARLSTIENPARRDPRHLGLGSYNRGVIFHRVAVRPLAPGAPGK